MKKSSIALLTLSMLAGTGSVFAADPIVTKGGSGTINFTGTINNDACSIEGAGARKSISVAMGDVSIKDMGTSVAPLGSGKQSAEDFGMQVSCNAGAKVSMIFDANKGAGSGLVNGTGVLKLIDGLGAAKNVGIALLDANGALIDLRTPATAKIENTSQDGSTALKFSASYVTTGDVKLVTGGRADATLPFTLQYE